MSKKIALFCALVGVLAFVACPAYAEVQNIKVSGEITAMGVYRNNYDLEDSGFMDPKAGGGSSLVADPFYISEDEDAFAMSVIKLRVDADMTDNVAACVQIGNVREWDNDATDDDAGATYDSTGQIELDLAYITLKEMLYSPLTVIIGRQNLMYGSGMIVGHGLYRDPNESIKYNDLSPFQGYDAVRAILDYDPWTLDFVYAKMVEGDDVAEGNPTTPDGGVMGTADDRDSDTELYGANLGYKFNQYDAEMEGYLFYKEDQNYTLRLYQADASGYSNFEQLELWTAGLRGSIVPIDNLTLSGEGAFQWGEMFDHDPGQLGDSMTRDREAWMGNVAAKYDFADVRFNPVLGLEYLYLSGEEVEATPESSDTSDFEAWHPIYRGKKMGSIRDTLENFYVTNDYADTSGWTNQQTIKGTCEVALDELVDGLSLDLAYLRYWFVETPVYREDEDYIGDEFNMALTYDYTEDVQFVVDGAWFFPGDYYDTVHTERAMGYGEVTADANADNANASTQRTSSDTAVSIIGSCKVTF